jgi:hypothetical protein
MRKSKPYYRIVRPFSNDGATDYCSDWVNLYFTDLRYAPDRQELWRAYSLIERDLLRLFEYVEPRDDNLSVYSHRTYELLLRTATEFETNCKRILGANGYRRTDDRNLNVKDDYFKINRSSRLGGYSISLLEWYPEPKRLKPFENWGSEEDYSPLPWYQSYNCVKHDRNLNFPRASLENVLNAVGGLYIILFSQFFIFAGPDNTMHGFGTSDSGQAISKTGDIFEVVPATNWQDDELYDFDWDAIRHDPDPFAQFSF